MGLTVLPSSLPTRGGSAAASRACASRLRLDPACIGSSATAAAAAKEPKRPGSFRAGEPLAKRRRVGEDAGVAAAGAMSLDEKNRVNRLLLSLLPPGRSPNEVIPLPDSIIRVLQENGTRSRGGVDDEIEIDVHALSDDALRVIKDRVGAYLADRAGSGEATKQSKEGVIEQSAPRSISSKAGPTSITPRAAPKSILTEAAPKTVPLNAAPIGIPSKAAWKSILLKDASKSIPSKAAPKSVPLNPAPEGTPSKAAPTSIPPRAAQKSIPPRSATKHTLLRDLPSPPETPKPSESRGSVSEHLETAISQSLPRSTPLTASLLLWALPNPSGSKKSMKELIADASKVMKKVIRRREIEKLRAAARREVEQMVRTVEFNDPYIDYKDVFK